MPDRIQAYTSQESVEDVRANDVVLPTVKDGGQIFSDLGRSAMDIAAPHLRVQAEEDAAKAVGAAEIVKDETGNYVRSNVPSGGGLIYRKALVDGLDRREASMRDIDFEAQLNKLSLDPELRRDPVRYSNAAAGLAEGMLRTVPDNLRPMLEDRWSRSVLDRSRGLGEQRIRELEASNKRGLVGIIQNNIKQVQRIFEQAGANASNPDIQAQVQTHVLEMNGALRSLRELGMGPLEAQSMAGEIAYIIEGEEQTAHGLAMLRDIAPVFAGIDTSTGAAALQFWAQGMKTDDTIAGMKYEDFEKRYPREVRPMIASWAREKRSELLAQETAAAAAEAKPETPSEYLSRLEWEEKGGFTGVPIGKEQAAGIEAAMRDRFGGATVTDIMAQDGGPEFVAGMVKKFGYAPVGTDQALQKLAINKGATAAADALYYLRNQTHDKFRAGETLFNRMPVEIRSLYSWVEHMRRTGMSDQDIDNLDRQRRDPTSKWRPLDYKQFEGYKNSKGQGGYNAIRDQAMADILKIDDVHALNASRSIWQPEFDVLMEANLNRFDDVRKALNATARTVSSLVRKSPWYWGGVGDSRLFNHGFAPRILDSVFKDDERFRGRKWTDVQKNGQPAVILKNVQDITYNDQRLGQYELSVFGNDGQLLNRFRVNMDDVMARHDAIYDRVKAQRAKDQVDAVRPPPFVLGTMPNGRTGYIPNPALEAWQERERKRIAASPQTSAYQAVGYNRY